MAGEFVGGADIVEAMYNSGGFCTLFDLACLSICLGRGSRLFRHVHGVAGSLRPNAVCAAAPATCAMLLLERLPALRRRLPCRTLWPLSFHGPANMQTVLQRGTARLNTALISYICTMNAPEHLFHAPAAAGELKEALQKAGAVRS